MVPFREPIGCDLGKRSLAWWNPQVPIIHEPDGHHQWTQSLGHPVRNSLLRRVERGSKEPERPVGKRTDIDHRVRRGTTRDRRHVELVQARSQLPQQLGLELRIGFLTCRMRERERRLRLGEVTVAKQRAAGNVMGNAAQALACRDLRSSRELLDGDERSICQDLMVPRELDAHLSGSSVLGRAVGETEDPPPGERRRVPARDATANEATAGVDRHDIAVVARSDQAPDPLPRAVAELDHGVVPKALVDVADVDVLPVQADALQQAVEELARGADEGDALAVLVEPGGLADEHQLGVGVALAEHHLGAALVQAAAGAAGGLGGDRLQLGRHLSSSRRPRRSSHRRRRRAWPRRRCPGPGRRPGSAAGWPRSRSPGSARRRRDRPAPGPRTAARSPRSGTHRAARQPPPAPRRRSEAAGMPATEPAARTPARMAAASASSAKKATRSMAAGTLGAATANTVSPSKLVWTGKMALAMPSWACTATRWASPLVRAALVATTARVVLPPGGTGTSPSPAGDWSGAVRRSRRAVLAPPGTRAPASTVPSSSSTSPPALTAARAPTVTGPASTTAQPSPPLVMCSGPAVLPTVAPMPAPTLPIGPSAVVAASQAASPSAGPGRASQSPTARSNSTAAGTIGIGLPKRA